MMTSEGAPDERTTLLRLSTRSTFSGKFASFNEPFKAPIEETGESKQWRLGLGVI